MVTLFWFRRDLRIADNPGLAAAVARGRPVVPVYLRDDAEAGGYAPGGASRWWLHGSLTALAAGLAALGSGVVLRAGPAAAAIDRLVAETGADAVYWSRRYEPWATARDERIKRGLRERGLDARSFNTALLAEPWTLRTGKGEPYRVFTPFRNALFAKEAAPAAAGPPRLPGPVAFPDGDDLASWALRPSAPDWAGGLRATWTPGEAAALGRLDAFLDRAVLDYAERRNLPAASGTSRLSPHLHFGEIGPRQVWHAARARALAATGSPMPRGVAAYLSEIAWREFSYHLLHHFPTLPEAPLRPEFAAFPWRADAKGRRAWERGLTGYPIVDAGMRELWQTGWMHNRVRMVVASFLIKDLLIDWRAGEGWFLDTLVDADLANNGASWQWVAGSGADAAPYFRVFNPVLQGAKFDPAGDYVRRFVPELARLPGATIHAPWQASALELADAGVRLGTTYPAPIVDHAVARARALAAFATIRTTPA